MDTMCMIGKTVSSYGESLPNPVHPVSLASLMFVTGPCRCSQNLEGSFCALQVGRVHHEEKALPMPILSVRPPVDFRGTFSDAKR